MKTRILLGIAMLIGIFTSAGDNCRYVTVTSTNGNGSISVGEGETAEIVSALRGNSYFMFSKDGLRFSIFPDTDANYGVGSKVAGPGTVQMICGSAPDQAYMTVKIIPATYDVNKTLILPPGTNQVFITLESSTNLVNWADATNGVYGSPDTARFFRIRMNTLASP